MVSCCTFGCRNRHVEREGFGFYRFPGESEDRRCKWILATRRKDWKPPKHLREFMATTSFGNLTASRKGVTLKRTSPAAG